MRAADLAVFADVLEGEARTLAARLGRVRRRLREAAMEAEARRALPAEAVRRLEALGVLTVHGTENDVVEAAEIQASLAALVLLRDWVRRELEAGATVAEAAVAEAEALGV